MMVIAAALVVTSLVTIGTSNADNWVAWRVVEEQSPDGPVNVIKVAFGDTSLAACQCAGYSAEAPCHSMVVP